MHSNTPNTKTCENIRRGRPITFSCDERREAIFAALESVHAESGLDGATMQVIAHRAGMSKRTLYDIFPGRTALLRSYMDKVADQFIRPLPACETDLPIADRLDRVLSQNIRHQGYGLPLEILRAFVAQVPTAPDIGCDLVDGLIQRDLSILTSELERGVARGEIKLEDTREAAMLLLDMVRPWPLESLLDPARLATPDTFAARRRLAIRVFLNGVAAPARNL
ncbi:MULTISPECIES: TetR/AcrR family transcriptional regulator [unclassified Roseovarius]|jgi:AcrR family transcriptional regulator|uniref:TetR/AcrR family transcriptional regulator n=1 Tax=unclassified Roseovarius TaxID=2614913 RepID=UPI00006848FC|nr:MULTISPECIES: TetR/AcrR family transcriptional regulator [unclassified Roseovarius]EAQ25743.1 transcriptional regulator, TetR family protein [Roseovarius sp. 217]KJS40856.1 MAG: TetR family transcriptional regulator [Roseovarius sp. BRH_c41]